MKICIDPGHGGNDPGAVGPTGVKEADVALAVALLLEKELEETFEVKLTRREDKELHEKKMPDLKARASLANEWGADLFVSLHCNAAENRSAVGFEVWTYPGWSLADKLATRLWESMREWFPLMKPRLDLSDGDVDKEAKFVVLGKTNMPAVLVELGFISNKVEEQILASTIQQKLFAMSLADGVRRYLKDTTSG